MPQSASRKEKLELTELTVLLVVLILTNRGLDDLRTDKLGAAQNRLGKSTTDFNRFCQLDTISKNSPCTMRRGNKFEYSLWNWSSTWHRYRFSWSIWQWCGTDFGSGLEILCFECYLTPVVAFILFQCRWVPSRNGSRRVEKILIQTQVSCEQG